MDPQSGNQMDSIRLFSEYMKITGAAHTGPEKDGDPALLGKRLGLLNGSSWITLWSNYFGRLFLPGVHLINVGNEAVQIHFMEAHEAGEPTPPRSNIDTFARYALDLVELGHVDAVLITCSTMNRSFPVVQDALKPHGVPVVQIDRPMMEKAVRRGGRILVTATHGPTVESTQALLMETAEGLEKDVSFSGLNVPEAWRRLAAGDVHGHNKALAEGIEESIALEKISSVVLAQLSMTVFLLSYPDPEEVFGIPVYTSGRCGFEYMDAILRGESG